MTKWILWGSVFWLAPLLCGMLINETKFKKNIVLGVTLPNEAHTDNDVLACLQRFKKQEILMAVGLLLLSFFSLLSFMDNALMTCWMIWIDLVIILPYVPYITTHQTLMRLKKEKGWKKESETVLVDTKAIEPQNWLSPLFFLPPVFISLIPAVFDQGSWPLYILNGIFCILFYFCYRYLYRNKSEMVDNNTGLTLSLTRIRRFHWGRMWLYTTWFMGLTSLSVLIAGKHPFAGILMMVILTVFICIAAFHTEMKMRKLQEKLTVDSGREEYIDEDDNWLGGIFYYNPHDQSVIINSRIGLNSTVNLASALGKVMIVLTILLVVGLPFLGISLDRLNTQEITLSKEDTVLFAKAGLTDYQIDLSTVDEVTLLNELPKGLSRRWGTGMDKLLKGHFTSETTGDVTVLLDPTVSPFLLLHNKDGYYLIGTRKGTATEQIYQEIR